MTKARDTANLVATGVPNSLITLDAAEIPNISTDKLTSGTLANARVADLPTSKITSGTFADARISAGSVTQHVTATDLQPLKSDLTALALREATNEASAAFNLPNQFIETFTDDTNLGTQTTGDRVSGYWATSVTSVGAFSNDSDTVLLLHMDDTGLTDSSSNNHTPTLTGNVTRSSAQSKFGSYSALFDGSGDDLRFGTDSGWDFTGSVGTIEAWLYPTNTSEARWITIGNASGKWGGIIHSGGNTTEYQNQRWGVNGIFTTSAAISVNNWNHIAVVREAGGDETLYCNGVERGSGSNLFTSGDLVFGTQISNYFTGHMDEIRISSVARYSSTFTPNEVTSANATGTLIQSANTVASAKTKVGGTMLYKDNAGTATIGTDLKIYFSCNNGGAWTEAASYNAITPVYSTGIKQVRLGETTCTSGTGIIYKAVWANQASGSKETQLHGIGINY